MAWPVSAETEIIAGVEYRNVWLRGDPELARAAVALGREARARGTPAETWATELCVAGYREATLIAVARATVRRSDRLGVNMAYLQTLTPDGEADPVTADLVTKAHEVLRAYALAHRESRLGGTVLVLDAAERLGKPAVTESFMVLAGFTPRDEPVFIRWFDHFKLIDGPGGSLAAAG